MKKSLVFLVVFFTTIFSVRSQDYIDVRMISTNMHYLGIGGSATYSLDSIVGLLPGETEDPNPTLSGFANEDLTDSLMIIAYCRRKANGDTRIVLVEQNNMKPLANIEFNKISPTEELYELNWPNGQTNILELVDTTAEFSMKWAVIIGYQNSGEYRKIAEESLLGEDYACESSDTPCKVHFPHDNQCTGLGDGGSGPFNINKVSIYIPCYGTSWVDLLSCCKEHDRGLWCANSDWGFLQVSLVNINFFGCVWGKIIQRSIDKTPWYCGGGITGAISGWAQGLIVGGLAYATVVAITGTQMANGDNCYLYKGNDLV